MTRWCSGFGPRTRRSRRPARAGDGAIGKPDLQAGVFLVVRGFRLLDPGVGARAALLEAGVTQIAVPVHGQAERRRPGHVIAVEDEAVAKEATLAAHDFDDPQY